MRKGIFVVDGLRRGVEVSGVAGGLVVSRHLENYGTLKHRPRHGLPFLETVHGLVCHGAGGLERAS